MKHLKKFNQLNENLDTDNSIELIGPEMDDILDALNFISDNYEDAEVSPTDFQSNSDLPYVHKRNSVYSVFVTITPQDDEIIHIRYINDLLFENNFKCKLYKTK